MKTLLFVMRLPLRILAEFLNPELLNVDADFYQ